MWILGESYTFVTHPGYYNKKPDRFPYERKQEELCVYSVWLRTDIYLRRDEWWDERAAYCDLIDELALRIKRDFSAGVIARWHDESHINRFLSELNPLNSRILTPSFCYPEDWNIPFEPIMVGARQEQGY